MREILFRGKRVYDGKWAEGSFLIPDKPDAPTQICIGSTKNVRLYCEVIPETVGQYTGLTDKNGKKIFEGDIVIAVIYRCYGCSQQIRREISIVGYDSLGVLGLKDKDGVWNDFMCELSLSGAIEDYSFEVIGTVFENVDLLEG